MTPTINLEWQNLKLHPSEHLAEWEILLQKRSTTLLLVLSRFHKHCDNLSDCLASFVSLWPGSVQFCSIRPFITGAGAAFTVTQDHVHSSQSENFGDCKPLVGPSGQFGWLRGQESISGTYLHNSKPSWPLLLYIPIPNFRLQTRFLCIDSPVTEEEF